MRYYKVVFVISIFCSCLGNRSIAQTDTLKRTKQFTSPQPSEQSPVEALKLTLRGRVVGGDDRGLLPGAHIYIGESKTPVVATDRNGEFVLTNLPASIVVLSVSYTGYQFVTKRYFLKKDMDIGTIQLVPVILDEVVITAPPPLAVQRGDTTQFNAGALKLAEDAYLEDLLKKLPGFELVDGKIMAQGQEVKKLYVDGTEYFLNNPTLALKNLPASLIARVKMYDDRSEEAKFSGYDDGKRMRSLNIETKHPDRLKMFGRGALSANLPDKLSETFDQAGYSTDVSLNMFDRKRQITLTGGFADSQIDELIGAKYHGKGRGNDAQNLAFNYASRASKNFAFIGSYAGGWTSNYSGFLSKQDYFPTENYESRLYENENHSWSDGNKHSINAKIDYQIGKKDRISSTWGIGLTKNKGGALRFSNSMENGEVLNNSNINSDSRSDNNSVNGNLSWMHGFKKRGRTFTVSTQLTQNKSNSEQAQETFESRRNSQNVLFDTIRNQLIENNLQNRGLSLSVSYSEPLTESARFSFNYSYRYSADKSDKEGASYRDNTFDERIEIDTALTNTLKNVHASNQIGVNYSYSKDKISYNGGGSIHRTKIENRYAFLDLADSVLKNDYIDFSPRTELKIRLKKNSEMTFSYDGNTSSPSAQQLQNVLDVSDPLQVSKGNPQLRRSYSHRVGWVSSISNPEKSTYFSISVSGNQVFDQIVQDVRFIRKDTVVDDYTLLPGTRLSTVKNLDGNWNAGLMTHYSFEIKKVKLRFNTSCSYNLSHTPSIYDGQENYTDAHRGNLQIAVMTNFSKDFELSCRTNSSYSYTDNSQTGNFRSFSQAVTSDMRWTFKNGFLVGGNYSYTYNQNSRAGAIDQSKSLLNLKIGKKFGKKRQVELEFAANDILRQRNTMDYFVSDLYTRTSYSTRVANYYTFSFNYRFNRLGK